MLHENYNMTICFLNSLASKNSLRNLVISLIIEVKTSMIYFMLRQRTEYLIHSPKLGKSY